MGPRKHSLTAQLDIKASDPIHVNNLFATKNQVQEIEEEKSGAEEESTERKITVQVENAED